MSFEKYEMVIGLEIHAQLLTRTKIFSSDKTQFAAGDNENVSNVSLGLPGALPVFNQMVLEQGVRSGIALNCKINSISLFARKNYFYPDLPKGYQISQHDRPLCMDGYVDFYVKDQIKRVLIQRAHLEEDAGKSLHFSQHSLINYNRSGVPLLEIVSAPMIYSAEEAAEYAKAVRKVLRFIGACDGNLEEGSLRCDCNVSVRIRGEQNLGTRVEIKNLNSFKFIEKAIDYEFLRQCQMLEAGLPVIQETRLFDSAKNQTFVMRTKEDAEDYRYFPDPDLLPILINEDWLKKKRGELGELPFEKLIRYQKDLGLNYQAADLLSSERILAELFEEINCRVDNAKVVANWILSEVLREETVQDLEKLSIELVKTRAKNLAELILLIERGDISGKIAKSIFKDVWIGGRWPLDIIKEQGLVKISDQEELVSLIRAILTKSPKQVAEFKNGKTKLFGFFVGEVMKATKGQADPGLVDQILRAELK